MILTEIGRKPKPASSEEMRLVHHALENATRRRIAILLTNGPQKIDGIAALVGRDMLDYHLNHLQLAGLIEIDGGLVSPTESGIAYGGLVRFQAENPDKKG